MMRVSIIGGSGFIGTRLCKRLFAAKKFEFLIIDKIMSSAFPNHTKTADVREIDSLRATIVDESVLVNLAAEHRDDVRPLSAYDEVNVQGARNLCCVARERNIPTIVFTSSVAIYGFAPIGTDESGTIAPFNDYGRTKYEAEEVFKAWHSEDPAKRTLVIVRPTVVFGEQNRGNVYNLLRQIVSGRFLMVGDGNNRKSMAYVENIAAFIEYALTLPHGLHVYNYVDKPDFTMNTLVENVRSMLGKSEKIKFRLPYAIGLAIGRLFDVLAIASGKQLTISSIRVKKFCSNTMFGTSVNSTGFIPPITLSDGLEMTVRYEFLETHENDKLFYSE